MSKRTLSSRYSDHMWTGQNNVALLLGSWFTSFLGFSCFLPHSSSPLLVMTNQNMQSQKDQWQGWRGAMRRLLYEKHHDGPQTIEQSKQVSYARDAARDYIPRTSCEHQWCGWKSWHIHCSLVHFSGWDILVGDILRSSVEEIHNCKILGPVNNIFPFLSLS